MSALTPRQRAALDLIKSVGIIDPPAAARHLDTSPEGAAATYSSLVRRGLVIRQCRGGHVVYAVDRRPA